VSNKILTPNPLTLVHDALWRMADAAMDLDNIVRAGNRIRFNSPTNRDPLKQTVADADLPELILEPAGTPRSNICNTSSTSMLTQRWRWVVSTGDLRANYRLLPVKWAIFVAMVNWKTELCALEWPVGSGRTFVKMANTLDAQEGESDRALNRGIVGWSCVWACEIEMHLKTQDIRNLLADESEIESSSSSA
jgi:hypothetical protein